MVELINRFLHVIINIVVSCENPGPKRPMLEIAITFDLSLCIFNSRISRIVNYRNSEHCRIAHTKIIRLIARKDNASCEIVKMWSREIFLWLLFIMWIKAIAILILTMKLKRENVDCATLYLNIAYYDIITTFT